MLAAFAGGLGEQVAFSFLPVYAVSAGVAPETGALWLSAFVVGNVALQWPIGWLADNVDRRGVLAGCTLISAALVIGLTFVPAQSLSIVGVIMLWGGISFAIYPVGLALLGQRFHGGKRDAGGALRQCVELHQQDEAGNALLQWRTNARRM